MAILTFDLNPDKTLPAGRGDNPGMVRPGWIVADVALVATGQDGNPIPNFILVKTDDFLLDYLDHFS